MLFGLWHGAQPEFCLTTQHLLPPPPPRDPDFIVGKHEILQKEILIWLFLVHKLLVLWIPDPPTPPEGRRTLGRGAESPQRQFSSGRCILSQRRAPMAL